MEKGEGVGGAEVDGFSGPPDEAEGVELGAALGAEAAFAVELALLIDPSAERFVLAPQCGDLTVAEALTKGAQGREFGLPGGGE